MSYAQPVEASNKGLYASVVKGFYSDEVFNPATNTMTVVSYFPIQQSTLTQAVGVGNKFTESLTCASQNPGYNCTTNNDCPGLRTTCGHCKQNKCVQ